MLYSKLGSIPKPETDGTDGWIEVPEPPVPAEGEEVVWWFPPGWVVRPVVPAPVEGHCWSWSQSKGEWVLCEEPRHDVITASTLEVDSSNSDIVLTTASETITIGAGSASDTIPGGV